jgi:hypothetical protein
MHIRYPLPGDIYRSNIYPDQTCRVVRVIDALVTFQWIGQYAHIEEQTAPVIRFARDFSHEIPAAIKHGF